MISPKADISKYATTTICEYGKSNDYEHRQSTAKASHKTDPDIDEVYLLPEPITVTHQHARGFVS